jgi:hypothetical protein
VFAIPDFFVTQPLRDPLAWSHRFCSGNGKIVTARKLALSK